jgi:predicted nuclease with TOPRIM domain
MIKKYFSILLIGAAIGFACVPARQLEECKEKQQACETELAAIKKANQENEAKLAELKEQLTKYEKENIGLKRDTNITGSN